VNGTTLYRVTNQGCTSRQPINQSKHIYAAPYTTKQYVASKPEAHLGNCYNE